ncbi:MULTISPECIES: GNAT family N-acetyltransferase [Maribacter]|uniref:GNAT family N-acetyltransferase n=1 Tax=Maribacter TaxID=252356 RepID=UPI0006912DC3|nr:MULTISPECIES: GNAT family N-acetyltransferase [Maribacter]|tara:strand:+ start:2331 stop:3434 length:1104 start_codon:yes stop_codon:yes gene_type:complete
MKSNTFKVFNIDTPKNFSSYLKECAKINDDNPFFKFDLNLNNKFSKNSIHYFVLHKANNPIILMPIVLRPITINNKQTTFNDVISPYGYSGPLISKETNEKDMNEFWQLADLWYKENNVITEFIRFSLNNNTLGYNGKIIPTLKNVCGELTDPNTIWNKFDKKVRNNYRKSVENQLTFHIYSGNMEPKIVSQFYDIYKNTMIRRNADIDLYFSLNYFQNYVKLNPQHCAIAIVSKSNTPISAEFLLLSRDTIYSYLGGTNADFFNCRPNDFLKVNIINWAIENGYKTYVLGGGRMDNDNLYAYKKSFFPKENDITFYTGRKIVNQEIYKYLNEEIKNSLTMSSINYSDPNTNDFFPMYRKPINSISI